MCLASGGARPSSGGDHIFLTSAVNTERNDRPALKVYTAAEVAPTTAVLRWVVYGFGCINFLHVLRLGGYGSATSRSQRSFPVLKSKSVDDHRSTAVVGATSAAVIDFQRRPVVFARY